MRSCENATACGSSTRCAVEARRAERRSRRRWASHGRRSRPSWPTCWPAGSSSSAPSPGTRSVVAAGPRRCWRSTPRRARRSGSTSVAGTCTSRSPTSRRPCSTERRVGFDPHARRRRSSDRGARALPAGRGRDPRRSRRRRGSVAPPGRSIAAREPCWRIGVSRDRRQRRQPRALAETRSVRTRSRGGRLREGRAGDRRRDRPRRPRPSRRERRRRGDRSRAGPAGRRPLPLRQSRLSRDGRVDDRAARRAALDLRRRVDGGEHARGRPGRRRRTPAGHHGRRPSDRAALADLCNSLNPDAIVVGGEISGGGWLLHGIRESIDRYAQPPAARAVQVVAGALGPRSSVLGALMLAALSDESLFINRLT